ncbi:Hydroxyethylthiazole kinase [Camellia lanceoleosa]|uniref:Hydroxyethylthiazole kinase n=1 Tax=Camellia lanceoleosa TaxID=1840588 RepID=A0ACC0IUI2_9ERIC|nr:Hydroxyethylthiazole kinase [Camellia lanceoleosa]
MFASGIIIIIFTSAVSVELTANGSEIIALYKASVGHTKGVDSSYESTDAVEPARFRCNYNCIESLDLSFLSSLLPTTNDLESLIVSANYSHDTTLIYFNFFNNTHHNAQCLIKGGLFCLTNLALLILRYIREFATLVVDVIVTDAEVLPFRSGSEDLILTKDLRKSSKFSLSSTLYCLAVFGMTLDYMSGRVYCVGVDSSNQSPDFPGMLNCPVGHLGNIKYYFDKRYDLGIH